MPGLTEDRTWIKEWVRARIGRSYLSVVFSRIAFNTKARYHVMNCSTVLRRKGTLEEELPRAASTSLVYARLLARLYRSSLKLLCTPGFYWFRCFAVLFDRGRTAAEAANVAEPVSSLVVPSIRNECVPCSFSIISRYPWCRGLTMLLLQ